MGSGATVLLLWELDFSNPSRAHAGLSGRFPHLLLLLINAMLSRRPFPLHPVLRAMLVLEDREDQHTNRRWSMASFLHPRRYSYYSGGSTSLSPRHLIHTDILERASFMVEYEAYSHRLS